jgi:hypothetical protein
MTVEFAAGPGGQPAASGEERQFLEDFVLSCGDPESWAYQLNAAYNNAWHFGGCSSAGTYITDVHAFLTDLSRVARMRSAGAKVVIKGTTHCDPGHVSAVLGGCLVRDRYVRVVIDLDGYAVPNLVPNVVYHLLVNVPEYV